MPQFIVRHQYCSDELVAHTWASARKSAKVVVGSEFSLSNDYSQR